MMSKTEVALLENVLDALDRLFDSKSRAIDIHALLFATSKALPQSNWIDSFSKTTIELEHILSLNISEEETREKALDVTNQLRIEIADALPFP
jgi:hypothetical protein